jgi:hypothetical protein
MYPVISFRQNDLITRTRHIRDEPRTPERKDHCRSPLIKIYVL